jgi:hypothetical protein
VEDEEGNVASEAGNDDGDEAGNDNGDEGEENAEEGA